MTTMMLSVDRFEIHAPIADVYDFLSDAANVPRWSAHLSAHAGVDPQGAARPDTPGLSLVPSPFSNRVMAYGWIGPYAGQVVFRLRPGEGDTTIVAARVRLALSGTSSTLVPERPDEARRAVVRDLDRVRRHLE